MIAEVVHILEIDHDCIDIDTAPEFAYTKKSTRPRARCPHWTRRSKPWLPSSPLSGEPWHSFGRYAPELTRIRPRCGPAPGDQVASRPLFVHRKGVCFVRAAFLSTAAPRRGILPDPGQQPHQSFLVSHSRSPCAITGRTIGGGRGAATVPIRTKNYHDYRSLGFVPCMAALQQQENLSRLQQETYCREETGRSNPPLSRRAYSACKGKVFSQPASREIPC